MSSSRLALAFASGVALSAVGVTGGCGTDATADGPGEEAVPTDEDGPCSDLPGDVTAAALAPNQTRIVDPQRVTLARSDLVVGAPLPATFTFGITRYIGLWEPEGKPGRALRDYVGVGALSKYARLSFRAKGARDLVIGIEARSTATGDAWRVLSTYDPDVAAVAKTDAILAPSKTDATLYTVTFPTEQLALAHARGDRQTNDLRLVLRSRGDSGSACANVVLGGATLEFFAQAPVVLVHGINDTQANCWADYAQEIERAGFIADRDVSFAGLSDKPGLAGGPPTYNGSVEADVGRIEERLARLLADYGTTDVHLVGHSKGGLDLVNFLAGPYPAMKSAGSLRVLSLQTLASPHGGSVLSDIIAPLKAWAKTRGYDGSSSWPEWGVVADGTTDTDVFDTLTLSGIKETVLLGAGPIEPGLSDLRTASKAVATDQAWKKDAGIRFATYAWDADFERSRWLDVTGQLTTPPSPSDLTPKYATDCRGNPLGSNRWTYYCIDEDEIDTFFWGTAVYPPNGTVCSGWNTCGAPLWRPMARGLRASVSSATATLGSRSTIHVDPTGDWRGNDLTVSVASARHPQADLNVVLAGAAPRKVSGLHRFNDAGGVEAYEAACGKTGANHIAILRRSRANMVACTAADTMTWMQASAGVTLPP